LLVICGGFAQGFNLVCRALAARGVESMAFEDPGYADQRAMAAHAGLEAKPVALDERGMRIDGLAATGARSVLLTPAHQSPTGVVLAPNRRQALIEWAVERGATILEDDYDAEFRYDREPVGAMQGLAPDRVAHLGMVSKSRRRCAWVGSCARPSSRTPSPRRRQAMTAAPPCSISSSWRG